MLRPYHSWTYYSRVNLGTLFFVHSLFWTVLKQSGWKLALEELIGYNRPVSHFELRILDILSFLECHLEWPWPTGICLQLWRMVDSASPGLRISFLNFLLDFPLVQLELSELVVVDYFFFFLTFPTLSFSVRTLPGEMNEDSFSCVSCLDLFAKGLGKESGVDFLTDGPSDWTGEETFDHSSDILICLCSIYRVNVKSWSIENFELLIIVWTDWLEL